MTGRLIKHELKAGARRMSNIYIAAGIACLAMLFSAFFRLCPNTTANVRPPFSITSLHDKSSHWGAMQEHLN